jgi:hypothetical protein
VATGDFGSGRMPPDMFYNYNEEIKRKKELTIRSRNRLIGRICNRDRVRIRDRVYGAKAVAGWVILSNIQGAKVIRSLSPSRQAQICSSLEARCKTVWVPSE